MIMKDTGLFWPHHQMEKEQEDQLYSDIKAHTISQETITATLLQRKFGLWFASANRVVDKLESEGIVWEQIGFAPREVLITNSNT
jgi:DNA segregation ATPase FtsK/SpoIIIE-like protein